MKIGWRFPPLSGGTKQGYTNNDIEGFKGEELIDNLAREICQNSLDAHARDNDEPVKVVFEMRKVETNAHEVFSGYERCLKGCRDYWSRGGAVELDAKLKTFLENAEATLQEPTINVLVASDYNTKGLIGSHNLDEISSPWEALTGADGMSVKPDDNSGGSFGIGKNAPFACSSLSMVFYNTFDKEDKKAFIGVGRVATLLNEAGKPTQRVGKYQKNYDPEEKWLPIYEEDADTFRDLFSRDEYGTDLIIVGFTKAQNWADKVSKAAIKNFFVAIIEKKLVIEVKDGESVTVINDLTIADLIDKYVKLDSELEITRQLYLAFTEPDNQIKIPVLGEEDAAEIYIKSEKAFSRTIANFRSTGMLVGKGYRKIFQHYAAILIVRGKKLGNLLRACEPPRHNRWDHKLIEGETEEQKTKRKTAKQALDYLNNELYELLKAQYEIAAGDATDAVGVSAYLPDADDGSLSEETAGTDILKVKVKIGKSKIKNNKPEAINVPGMDAEGENLGGNAGNQGARIGPDPDPIPGPIPGPGPGPEPGPNPGSSPDSIVSPGNGNNKGAIVGNGARSISVRELHKRRVFPMSVNVGLYKIVILPGRDYEKLFVECAVAGEDGKADQIKINKFMYNGKSITCKGGKAGPLQVSKGVPAEFMVTFDKKEKMGLNLILTEGGEL